MKTNVIVYEENSFEVHIDPVSDKVALLIANSEYENLAKLPCPENDVTAIANILQKQGFKTICFKNLSHYELQISIEIFASMVKEESLVFFYYAGHGFEMGDRFLLPSNYSNGAEYNKEELFPESLILSKILKRKPLLLVHLLDMCLKLPQK